MTLTVWVGPLTSERPLQRQYTDVKNTALLLYLPLPNGHHLLVHFITVVPDCTLRNSIKSCAWYHCTSAPCTNIFNWTLSVTSHKHVTVKIPLVPVLPIWKLFSWVHNNTKISETVSHHVPDDGGSNYILPLMSQTKLHMHLEQARLQFCTLTANRQTWLCPDW